MPFLRLGSALFPLHSLPGYSLTGCISIFFFSNLSPGTGVLRSFNLLFHGHS